MLALRALDCHYSPLSGSVRELQHGLLLLLLLPAQPTATPTLQLHGCCRDLSTMHPGFYVSLNAARMMVIDSPDKIDLGVIRVAGLKDGTLILVQHKTLQVMFCLWLSNA